MVRSGRHFLQIPGPTNVPDRFLRAMDMPTIDHRGPVFAELGRRVLAGMKRVFRTEEEVFIFPSSGTGAWEAALVNTLSPGDRVLMYETGHFATLWKDLAERLGLVPEFIAGDWRGGADADAIGTRLEGDTAHAIKAVCVVHNETSTGAVTDIAAVRAAIDRTGHPALLMVDTISSLASMDYRHDEWGVDVTVGGSQKGLMLPPGLSFNVVSAKARSAGDGAGLPRSYWSWDAMRGPNANGVFPYTPATNLLYGLAEALAMLEEQGLDAVFARHARHGEATRRAVRAWGLELLCTDPRACSNSLTAVLMPEGHDADAFRKTVLESFDMSLGNGLSKVAGRVFRIGHLGDFNDLMLAGTLAGVEMGLARAGVPHRTGGVQAALDHLAGNGFSGLADAVPVSTGGRATSDRARIVVPCWPLGTTAGSNDDVWMSVMNERQQAIRQAADSTAKALIAFKEVQAIALLGVTTASVEVHVASSGDDAHGGDVARPEGPVVALAVWLERFHRLDEIRGTVARALNIMRAPGPKLALEDVSITILEFGTDRYVGALCHFNKCPAHKPECQVAGCGAVGHLRQFRDYRFDHAGLAPGRCAVLFDRATATVSRAADLPDLLDTAPTAAS